MSHLPKDTPVGKVVVYKGRKFKRIKKTGFPQWQIVGKA